MTDKYTHIMTGANDSQEWLIQLKGGSFTWTNSKTRNIGVIFLGINETLEGWAMEHNYALRKFKHFTGNI